MANTQIPRLVHVAAGVWLAAVSTYGVLSPDGYELLMQEDRIIEWATVWLFLIAGVCGLRRALRDRCPFDGLVAVFCLFVAGEEFSWGQRLIGYYPPEFFLENNFQQEANLHNLPQSFLQPKWVLMIALAGYGGVLPLAARHWGHLLTRLGATAPPRELGPWFLVAAGFLVWYPLTYTGEWTEAFAGGLFLLSSGLPAKTSGRMLSVAIGLAVVMTTLSAEIQSNRDQQHMLCAQREIAGLLSDIASGSAGTNDLWQMRRVHKRLWSSVSEGYLQSDRFESFNRTICAGQSVPNVKLRHKYGIDPWGSPYWLEVERTSHERRSVTIYSFGPNRRRDRSAVSNESDDLRASITHTVH